MPIDCESVKNVKTAATYGSDKEFVLAYPKPNPITPLGSSWQFAPCFLPEKYVQYKDNIENFEVHPDDVFSITFPKSGSTWCQEMIWLLNNDLDYATAEKINIFNRFLQIELDICFKNFDFGMLERADTLPSPRHLKSHLPVGLLPSQIWTVKPRIIYVSRGRKDNAISYYNHYKKVHLSNVTKVDFMETFLEDQVIFSPQHNHVKDFWFLRNEENVLFLTYEEMKRDLFEVLIKTSKFLGKNYSEEQLRELEQFLSFESMSAGEDNLAMDEFLRMYAAKEGLEDILTENQNLKFFRKGVVGNHLEELSSALIDKFNEQTKQFNANNNVNLLP